MGPPGHLGIGFAAKRIAPKAPLWALLVATEVPDLPLLFEGSPLLGLGLWGSGLGLILSGVLELALLAGGIAMYWGYGSKGPYRRVPT